MNDILDLLVRLTSPIALAKSFSISKKTVEKKPSKPLQKPASKPTSKPTSKSAPKPEKANAKTNSTSKKKPQPAVEKKSAQVNSALDDALAKLDRSEKAASQKAHLPGLDDCSQYKYQHWISQQSPLAEKSVSCSI